MVSDQCYLQASSKIFRPFGGCNDIKGAYSVLTRAGSHSQRLSLQGFVARPPERKSINLKEIIVPGKYNFIDFWASWCGPCRAAIPSVKQLQQKLGDKLNIISISVDKKRQDWERAMEVEKMTFLFGRKSEVIERKNILWRFLNKVLVPVIQKKEDFDT